MNHNSKEYIERFADDYRNIKSVIAEIFKDNRVKRYEIKNISYFEGNYFKVDVRYVSDNASHDKPILLSVNNLNEHPSSRKIFVDIYKNQLF